MGAEGSGQCEFLYILANPLVVNRNFLLLPSVIYRLCLLSPCVCIKNWCLRNPHLNIIAYHVKQLEYGVSFWYIYPFLRMNTGQTGLLLIALRIPYLFLQNRKRNKRKFLYSKLFCSTHQSSTKNKFSTESSLKFK